MSRRFTPGFILLLLVSVFLTACGSNSDALSILQSENISLKATVASYATLSATVTAEATIQAQKLATTQAEMNQLRSQNNDLVAKLNTGSTTFNSTGSQGNSSDPMASTGSNSGTSGNSNVTSGNADPKSGQDNSAADSNTFSFSQVVTAKQRDSNGCAVGQSNVFSVNDEAIWVIADVRNFKSGTEFTAKWTGDNFNHEDSWTIPQNGTQICVHFYIEPATLEMAPGTYTVTMLAGTVSSDAIQFTVEGDTASK